jgi:hypothetical protein
MDLHPYLRVALAIGLAIPMGWCTRVGMTAMERMKRGEIARFEGWATVALMMTMVLSAIPLASWLGILPR